MDGKSPPSHRKRQRNAVPPGGILVWARDGPGEKAAVHPAYLLPSAPAPQDGNAGAGAGACDDNNSDSEEGHAWVQWASTGTASQIPRSRIMHELPSRRGRRSLGDAALDGGASPDENHAIKSNTAKRKRSRLSLTKEQRRQFKEHHGRRKSEGRGADAEEQRQPEHPQGGCETKEHPNSTSTGSYQKRNNCTEIVDENSAQLQQQPAPVDCVQTEVGHGNTRHSLSPKQTSTEVEIIDIADSDDEEEGEGEGEKSCTKDTHYCAKGCDGVKKEVGGAKAPPSFLTKLSTLREFVNGMGVKAQEDELSGQLKNSGYNVELALEKILMGSFDGGGGRSSATASSLPSSSSKKKRSSLSSSSSAAKTPKSSIKRQKQGGGGRKSWPGAVATTNGAKGGDGAIETVAPAEGNPCVPKRQQPQLSIRIPEPPTHSTTPTYTHRSSAYVQHLAEACTLIMTDGRWRTCQTANGEPPCEVSTETALFSREIGDDMSAVKAFMSLYDAPTVQVDAEAEPTTESDEVFERAMHLYSRMFHRKGPWFDLADLYLRYYAPKPVDKRPESPEQEEISPSDSLVSSGSEGAAEGKACDKRRNFFTPRSSFDSVQSNSSKKDVSTKLILHKSALEQFFSDVLRLLSIGLLRSFESEYECGLVAGNATAGRRGALLLAEERREVLRRLGGGRSPKGAQATSTGPKGVARAAPLTNEILAQMQSQQSLLSSFAQNPAGGESRAKTSLLPVIKHVDKVLIRKLATKVAALVSDSPRKAEVDEAERVIRLAWATAYAGDDNAPSLKNDIVSAFCLREAPLMTLRRCMRLFLCAGGGPGAMRGDGTNGWISVLDEESSADRGVSSSRWHGVSYPGLSSRLGLEHYELGHCYTPLSMASPSSMQLEGGNASLPSTTGLSSNVFLRYCEFQLWEIGAELRGFVDTATEAYEREKMLRRRREKELSTLNGKEEAPLADSNDATKATIFLLRTRGSALLTDEGREQVIRSVLFPCFNEGQWETQGIALDSTLSEVRHQVEVAILSLSRTDDDSEEDGFSSDTERMIAAAAVICHSILLLRIKHPSSTLVSLAQRPWLRHICFDSILAAILWDCVPFLERRGYHAMAVSVLQTFLFGGSVCNFTGRSEGALDLCLAQVNVKPHVQCLLSRRTRGKAYERLVIDATHADRRLRKSIEPKPKKKGKTSKEEEKPSSIQVLCGALLENAEAFSAVPFCSLRNLARRVKASSLPQSDERSLLNIRPTGGNDWCPITDVTVANAICSDSDEYTGGKRCAFVGWEDGQGDDVTALKRSLNVEELAMEEYHFGRLPCKTDGDSEEVKGQWVGWHNEGGHVRALFRIMCLQHLIGCCPKDDQGMDEQRTIFLTPYQFSPHDLHVGFCKVGGREVSSPIRGFYERRRAEIESFLSDLNQMEAGAVSDLVFEAVEQRWNRHADDRSRLKDPRLLKDVRELRTLSMVAAALGPSALAQMFRTLCLDYRHWAGGLPDLLLVRARCASSSDGSDPKFVDLSDWIGEGFSKAAIEENKVQELISLLADRDDEFLGCAKNGDGTLGQQKSSRRKQGTGRVELPSFPERLALVHAESKVRAECMFVEVKSANDRLSERQEDWLSIMENCTNARVCKFTEKSKK
ncbi:hypothetical protein ACHAXT_002091 [Thalassiosira profunda]